MDDRISAFIDKLKMQLKSLPEEEISKAVSYYEEFLNDALDAGNDLDSIISKLETPEKIAASIKTEAHVANAEANPGLGNFFKAMKSAFKSVSAPFSIFLLSIVVLCTFCIVITFFGGALAVALCSLAVFLTTLYEALRIPFRFFLEKIGTLGMGLTTVAMLMFLTIYLYKLGNFFIKLSSKQIRIILKLSGRQLKNSNCNDNSVIAYKYKRINRILLTSTIAGLLLFGVSGLPWKFFVIFNSMKPESSTNLVTAEYDTHKINRIEITTAHSTIKVKSGLSDKITISYEEPNWLTHEINNSDGVLYFREKSNGRLPIFSLISLHPSTTELHVTLPKGYNFDSLNLQSTGGKILITDITGNIEVKNTTETISYTPSIPINKCNISASSGTGQIFLKGVRTSKRINGRNEYYNNTKSSYRIRLESTTGDIDIE